MIDAVMDLSVLVTAAAETEGHGAGSGDHHGGGLFSDTYFWVGLGFVIFIAMIGRRAWGMISQGLDDRSDRIAKQIEDARELREEAQKHLAEIERRNKDARKEADTIEAQAADNAKALLAKAEEEAEDMVRRRTAQVEARIGQLEAQALTNVKSAAAQAATQTVRKLLSDRLAGSAGQEVLDTSINEVAQRLH